jgi:hypothetical protein
MKELLEGFKELKHGIQKLAEEFLKEFLGVLSLFREKIEQFFEKLYDAFIGLIEKIGQSLEKLSAQLSFKKKIKQGKSSLTEKN